MAKIDDAFIKVYSKRHNLAPAARGGDRHDVAVVATDGTASYRIDQPHVKSGPNADLMRSNLDLRSSRSGSTAPAKTIPNEPAPQFPALHVEVVGYDSTQLNLNSVAVIASELSQATWEQLETQARSREVEPERSEAPQQEAPRQVANNAAPTTSSVQQSPAENQVFHPVWEVDAFAWPETIEQLETGAAKALGEAGRSLRRATADGLRVIGITSTGRGQGRTTVAIQLARTAAQHGLRVILVDADVDRPVLADRLGVEAARGWIDAINDGLPLEEVAIYSVAEHLTLLPLLPWPTGAVQLREATAMIPQAFARLSMKHDLVIVDCGSIGALGTLFHDAEHQSLQSALLVTDERAKNPSTLAAGVARLKRLGIKQLGIIENFAS